MGAGLNLPKRFFVSIVVLLALTTVIWVKTESALDKKIINYLSGVFVLSAIHGTLLIRMGKFDVYKNVLNAIWNIYTACAFLYGIHITLDYSGNGDKVHETIIKSFISETELLVLPIIFLGVVCVVRAGYSVAEIFKISIIESRKKRIEYQQNDASE